MRKRHALMRKRHALMRKRHARGSLSWEAFLSGALPEARTLIRDRSDAGIEAYLAVLASWACQLDPAAVAAPAAFGPYEGFPEGVAFGLSFREEPLLGVQFEMEPGTRMPFHPHPGGSVCTLLLEGSAQVENYEFVGEPDWEAKGHVVVARTRSELLLPGDVNRVANPRSNIHGFLAGPAGARGIDFTTGHRPQERRPDSLLTIEPEPFDRERDRFHAHWRAK